MTVTAPAPAPVRSPLPDGLAGSTVVILGGTSGLGLAAGRLLHGLGARVVLSGRDKDRLDGAVASLQGGERPEDVLGGTADAADEDAVRAVFDLVDRVDHVLVTAGGFTGAGPLGGLTSASVAAAYDTRVWGALATARVAAERLPAGGSITLTSGILTLRPVSGTSGVVAAVGAVETLAPALAVEFAPRRLRVNTIRYGSFDTPLLRGARGLDSDEAVRVAGEGTPLGRFGTAEEAAAAAVFLIANPYITGQVITVDGGQSLV
ncbi:SDR family oxidoreductase [Actinocorallia sp. API 0066]|uniref:SDR family oxidoreductase n=1 Tax=Actinocorallia sp. API 0066 TaxID=2896846 RepID=UPI001E4EA8EE|nr:SDR family oxidoreductase [Actinocorallia sp. API 0066]MCD0450922.1 SDR family oxidoreductase [Actinocorallia sp. API 0066]